MDFEHEKFDGAPDDLMLDISKTQYAIYSYYSQDFLKNSLAIACITPSSTHNGGAIRVFSEFGTPGQGYIADFDKLKKKFTHFKKMIERERNGILIWEGKLNGLTTKQEICQYESPWIN